MPSFRIFAASQAKSIYLYKNLRTKVQKCCAYLYFNQQCINQGVIPKYAKIKVPYTSPASTITQKKMPCLRTKKDSADVLCVTLIELQAHRDAFIQNVNKTISLVCIL